MNIPKKPISLARSSAPCIKQWPKEVIGTNAPPLAKSINLSYILNTSKKDPITTNISVTADDIEMFNELKNIRD